MKWYQIIFVFIVLLGASQLAYRIYQITVTDAKSRGLKHPHFWGLFAIGGQNSGGLIMYLIGRRNYPSQMSKTDKQFIESQKKRIGVALLFIVIGTICLIITETL